MTNLNQFSPETRVWIYQSDRPFSDEEVDQVQQRCKQFVKEWAAHGKKLKAAIEVLHHCFVVVFADEREVVASGCSIDESVRFVHRLNDEFSFDLLNRMVVVYKNGNSIQHTTLSDLPDLNSRGVIDENTIVFDPLVKTKEEFDRKWETPMRRSWHRQYLKAQVG